MKQNIIFAAINKFNNQMFKRSIIDKLRQWAESPYRKPLILRGARQVGKTTVIGQFGEEFENFLPVNLEKEDARHIFETHDDVNELLSILFLYCKVKQLPGRTLLFIDEIQASPRAVAQLRYFYEELPELYVIAAGSLLETTLDRHISLPVGRVEYMALHPCSFIEFLGAIGEERYVDLIQEAELPKVFHRRLMSHFTTYALIGGMPEVIRRYAASNDFLSLSAVYNQLLNAYKNDVEKYAGNDTQKAVIRYILEEGWDFAGQNITLGGFASSSYKARETGEAFRTLEKAMILELVYPTVNTMLPITADLKRSPKLIWLDAGIVNYTAHIQKEYLLTKELTDVWRGMAAEQIAAQELKALSFDVGVRLKYWIRAKRGSSAEVDFVYLHDGMVIPIEVKSGHNAHLRSLHQFMAEAPHQVAVRIWSGPFSIDDVRTAAGNSFRLINLPFYYVGSLPRILEKV